MKALTIQQPWAAAIAYLGKNVENRDWPCPVALIGQDVAIHASAALPSRSGREMAWAMLANMAGADAIAASHLKTWDDLKGGCGHVLAVATIAGCYSSNGRFNDERPACPIDDSPWFFGEYGFHLTNVRPLAGQVGPVKGQLGFWNLPDDIAAEIRDQLATMAEIRGAA